MSFLSLQKTIGVTFFITLSLKKIDKGQLSTRSAYLAKNNPRGFANFKEKPDFIVSTNSMGPSFFPL